MNAAVAARTAGFDGLRHCCCSRAATHVWSAADTAWLDDRGGGAGVRRRRDGSRRSRPIEPWAQRSRSCATAASCCRKGYGEADRDTHKKVAPDTLFRIGSVSKVFVWVAVMQQVAAGRLDLNTDVNTYLKDLQIPETFPAADHADASHDAHCRFRGQADHRIVRARSADRRRFPRKPAVDDAATRVDAGPPRGVFELRRGAGRAHRRSRFRARAGTTTSTARS